MKVPNYFIKTDREKEAVKTAKSEFKQSLKSELGPNYKRIHNQNVTVHKLTN
jgi:hypothetical protein